MAEEKIEVENVNAPGRTTRVDATMYRATRTALLRALPDAPLDAATATLDAELDARRDPKAQRYWTKLMKGEAVFRGVPMAGFRASVRRVWSAHELASWSVDDLLALAQHWFAGAASEDQLAAVLLLTEHAHARLRARRPRRCSGSGARGWSRS